MTYYLKRLTTKLFRLRRGAQKSRKHNKDTLPAIHALLFELGLLVVTIPLVASWLKMTLWQAFVVDLGFVVFFLMYAFVYNWLFDCIYLQLSRREIAEEALVKLMDFD